MIRYFCITPLTSRGIFGSHLAASSVRPPVPFNSTARLARIAFSTFHPPDFLAPGLQFGKRAEHAHLEVAHSQRSIYSNHSLNLVLQDHCLSSVRLRLQTAGCWVAPISRTQSLGRSRGVTFAPATSDTSTDRPPNLAPRAHDTLCPVAMPFR